MTGSEWVQFIAGGATVILLIAAATSDLLRYRISNQIVLAVIVAFLVAAVFEGSWPALGWSALAGAAMFLLGAGLFALRVFGGGDAKLIAAMALWTGLADLPRFLLIMSAAGGVLGIVWLVRRRRQRARLRASGAPADSPAAQPEADLPRQVPNKLPYGVAIAAAGFDYFVSSAHSPFAHVMPWVS